MAFWNVITFRGGTHEVVVDVRVDFERGLIVGAARGMPIVAEEPDVASLRAALDRLVAEHFAALPKTAPRRPTNVEPPAPPISPEVADVVARMVGAAPRSEAAKKRFVALLPGASDLLTPPPRWGSWRMPPDPSALDEAVDTLLRKHRKRSAASDGPCPFWRARAAVVHAIDASEDARRRYAAARDDGAAKRARLRALAASSGRLDATLAAHAAILDGAWPDLFEGWRDATREGFRENRLTDDALAIPGLRQRLDDAVADVALTARAARAVGEAVGNSEADAGKRAFIARMLGAFREIFGGVRGDQPIAFVDAAAEAAGLRGEGDPSWRATTKKIQGEPQFAAFRTPL